MPQDSNLNNPDNLIYQPGVEDTDHRVVVNVSPEFNEVPRVLTLRRGEELVGWMIMIGNRYINFRPGDWCPPNEWKTRDEWKDAFKNLPDRDTNDG